MTSENYMIAFKGSPFDLEQSHPYNCYSSMKLIIKNNDEVVVNSLKYNQEPMHLIKISLICVVEIEMIYSVCSCPRTIELKKE